MVEMPLDEQTMPYGVKMLARYKGQLLTDR